MCIRDSGGSIEEILIRYPNVKIISTEKAFLMMRQFHFTVDGHVDEVKEGDTRKFGKHEVTFVIDVYKRQGYHCTGRAGGRYPDCYQI